MWIFLLFIYLKWIWIMFIIEEHCKFINKVKIVFYVTFLFQANQGIYISVILVILSDEQKLTVYFFCYAGICYLLMSRYFLQHPQSLHSSLLGVKPVKIVRIASDSESPVSSFSVRILGFYTTRMWRLYLNCHWSELWSTWRLWIWTVVNIWALIFNSFPSLKWEIEIHTKFYLFVFSRQDRKKQKNLYWM
jgi:hypothetical protein